MRLGRGISAILLGGGLLLSGCASGRRENVTGSREGVFFEGSAIILTGSALTDGPGTVLAALSGKVPNFRVRRRAGQCPQITLRGHTSFEGLESPYVYVDGTRAMDTCVLETLQTGDVERVEVYPQGVTTRPGYGTQATGLILVFMRSS